MCVNIVCILYNYYEYDFDNTKETFCITFLNGYI